MMKHRHHKIPRHAGGTNDPSNIIVLSVEDHAEAHRKLFEQYGRWEDEVAWKGLSKMITSKEVTKIVLRNNGYRSIERKTGLFDPKNKDKIKHDHILNRDHKGSLNPQFGTMWITDGLSNMKIKKGSDIPMGYRSGRVNAIVAQK